MNPALVAIAGPLTGTTFELTEAEVSIGRHPSSRLCIPSTWVSRRHCLITRRKEQLTISDLDSSHGTFVNGVPVKKRVLKHGDRIAISDSLFLFVAGGAETSPDASPARLEERQLIAKTASRLRWKEALSLQSEKLLAALPASARLARDLSSLFKASTTLASLRDAWALQQRLLELVLEAVPADLAVSLLLGEGTEEFATVLALDRRSGIKETARISRAIAIQVAREGTAILSNDLAESGGPGEAGSAAGPKVRAVLCVPLAALEQVIGVLYLEARDPTVSFDSDHLQVVTAIAGIAAAPLETARRLERLEGETRRLQTELNLGESMVGDSPPMREVQQFIAKVAPTDATILVRGETGTGKELVARAIHVRSPRAAKPFVVFSCAALSETLLESELFGHERGAFTGALAQRKGRFELADGGTVFLDEIAEISPAIQAKLLRVLQDHQFERVGGSLPLKVDIRLIAATNRDLETAVRAGTFREDLYYRINVVSVRLPPLRERREDIPLLANHFVARYGARFKRRLMGLSPEARECLMGHDWPGNIRELENAIERAVVLGADDLIRPEDLPESLLEADLPKAGPRAPYHEAIREAKKRVALNALKQAGGSYTRAAKLLGVHANHLHRLIRNLQLKTTLKK
ncbi:MAG: sigma 54-interacting transcriptional regulator [Candidatus Rokubacteria bacterium]|nr:sigma 54-interacting transcriptional regulator [Candidatus Rokubacteria bacterium]